MTEIWITGLQCPWCGYIFDEGLRLTELNKKIQYRCPDCLEASILCVKFDTVGNWTKFFTEDELKEFTEMKF